jgi:hypothetical protein
LTHGSVAERHCGVVETVAGLVRDEVALLRGIVERRRPELLPLVDRIGTAPLNDFERASLRRAVVDELCEQPAPGQRTPRRDIELADLLLHLGQA